MGLLVPDNAIIRSLVQALGNPILTMSLHEEESVEYITDPELIHERYDQQVDVVIEASQPMAYTVSVG